MVEEKKKRSASSDNLGFKKSKRANTQKVVSNGTKKQSTVNASSTTNKKALIPLSNINKNGSCNDERPSSSEYEYDSYGRRPLKLNGVSVVHTIYQLQSGSRQPCILKPIVEGAHVQLIEKFKLFTRLEVPELRITAMQWHPSKPSYFVIGGKSGSLQLFQLVKDNIYNPVFKPDIDKRVFEGFPGIGPGGTIEAIRFNTKRSGLEVCTASVEGTVCTYNFETNVREELVITTNPYSVWFCAVDVHQDGKSIFAVDNKGVLAIHHLDSGITIYDNFIIKLHSSKVKHLEFNQRDPHLMATASLDKSVKLWDVRMLADPVKYLKHKNGVNAAKFSLTDGCRLLTSDLHDELRVYMGPNWDLEHTIQHPHRTFQHLTPIKASWHPCADLFAIGRYPDPKMKDFSDIRSVDVYSATSGKMVHELLRYNSLITSLSGFNSDGTTLATSSGRSLYLSGLVKKFLIH